MNTYRNALWFVLVAWQTVTATSARAQGDGLAAKYPKDVGIGRDQKTLPLMIAFVFASSVAAMAQSPSVTVPVKSRDELQQAVAKAKPGTKIVIASGTYDGGLAFAGLQGAKDKPIILAAADSARPPVIHGNRW